MKERTEEEKQRIHEIIQRIAQEPLGFKCMTLRRSNTTEKQHPDQYD